MDNNVHEHVKYEAENVLKNIQEESRDEDLDTVTINYQISQKSRKEREERLPWPFNAMKQERLNEELDFENNVELKDTMWRVLRCKPPLNDVLQKYETSRDMCRHKIRIGDVVKFGRVNFKVCALKCEGRIRDEFQGGYHLLEKKNIKVLSQMEKLQKLSTDHTMHVNENIFTNVDNTRTQGKLSVMGTNNDETFDRDLLQKKPTSMLGKQLVAPYNNNIHSVYDNAVSSIEESNYMMFPGGQNHSRLTLNEHLNTKNENTEQPSERSQKSSISEQPVCRICLGTEEEGQDLID